MSEYNRLREVRMVRQGNSDRRMRRWLRRVGDPAWRDVPVRSHERAVRRRAAVAGLAIAVVGLGVVELFFQLTGRF